jgi:O-antigen ligase
MVHLGAIWAFFACGLAASSKWISLPLIIGAGITGSAGRGGFLGFLAAIIVTVCILRQFKRLLPIAVSVIVALILAIAVDPHLSIPGSDRELSSRQFISNLLSIGGDAEGSLEATKGWRLAWWNKIIDYTVYGPYFWMGKGYGINLADSDGFQTNGETHDLRSPHNSHLTLLARSGVPGVLLWSIVQLIWFLQICKDVAYARRRGLRHWVSLFVFLIAYWTAYMVSAAFDVMFEGPASGIPFWTLVGVGWGAHILLPKVASARFRHRIDSTSYQTAPGYLVSVGRISLETRPAPSSENAGLKA